MISAQNQSDFACGEGENSLEFCRILIEAYPGSERVTNDYGSLPFHLACGNNTVAVAKYFLDVYPESLKMENCSGKYPIHYAIDGLKFRTNPATAIEMVQFLLDCNPSLVLQEFRGKLPLYWICRRASTSMSSVLNAALKVMQLLYDADPEAIERDEIASNVDNFHQKVQIFINTQLIYARLARDHGLMTRPGENEQLPQ